MTKISKNGISWPRALWVKHWSGIICTCLGVVLFYAYHCLNSEPTVLVFPGANSRDTYFTMHKIKEAHLITQGKGCKIGILDHGFGIDNHPELYADGKSFVVDHEDFLKKHEWHGYWMAITLHEIAPQAEIYALHTHSFQQPKSTVPAIEKAIDWAIENGLCVLTYSQAEIAGNDRKVLDAALDRAHHAGIITTFINTEHPKNILPSGMLVVNQGDHRVSDIKVLPYDYNVVQVSGWKEPKQAPQSSSVQFLSISSMSPVVGGVVALMKSVNPKLSPTACKKIIQETGYIVDYQGQKIANVLNAQAAVQRAKQSKL